MIIMDIEKLYNILLSDKPSDNILASEKEIFLLIPELENCKGFNQNNEWHIYDVYEHILHVIDNVPSNLNLRLAALFHDIGKPLTYTQDEKGIGHFYGHWEKSKEIFDSFANSHNIDKSLSNLVSNLIYYHDVNISKLSDKELNALYDKFGIEGIKMLYELKKADLLAQNNKYHYLLEDYKNQKEKILSKYK